MNEIIKEVKENKHEDIQIKVFIFMIKSIDIFKKNPKKFLKELDIILNQISSKWLKM
jgi:hypothetical protein